MSALVFDHVNKSFAHHVGQKLLRERIVEMFSPSHRERFQALKDVSFEVSPGDSLGLIGHNGAGKSTILNLACGLTLPDSGRIEVNGKVVALLELGFGFHSELTGAENLRINAAFSGLTRRQTAERFEEIVEFSGVRDFIDEPLRTYSNGMGVRLAFSVAIHTSPEILIVDEAIGGGDQAFFLKCLDRMRDLQRRGTTLLLASHSAPLLGLLCQQGLWLDHGRVMSVGPIAEVLEAYQSGVVSPAAQSA
jgi:ABC-type polysaccharide/polyol phosphate transport system ATPase subunit